MQKRRYEKSGGDKSAGDKSGGGKAGGGKAGGGKSDGGKSGGGKASEAGKGGTSGGGSGVSGSRLPGDTNPREASDDSDEKQKGNAVGGAGPQDDDAQKNNDGVGDGNEAPEATKPNDQQIDQAAKAAGLALKRLDEEIQRGEIDPKLLEELGWTQEDVRAFLERMQKQLDEREVTEQVRREKSLSQRSFEEMLKSLDVHSTGKTREGTASKDRDQQDTTGRQSTPPNKYKQRFLDYQRSQSGLKEGKRAE